MIVIENILDVPNCLNDIDVVVFDLDDTLYCEKDYVKSGFHQLALAYPNIKDFENRLWNAFLSNEKAIDFVLKQEGLLGEKEKCLEIYRNHRPNISLSSDVENMLIELKKSKRIGIITDGRPTAQNAKIDSLGLNKYIDKIIITDTLGGISFRKPNIDSFVLMKSFFNCPYNKMVYVGDNIEKDFVAPAKLGMNAIYYKNKNGIYYKEESK